MRRLKLQVQVSLDGMVGVQRGHHFNWDEEVRQYSIANAPNVDRILLGRKTATGFIPHWKSVAANPNDADREFGKLATEPRLSSQELFRNRRPSRMPLMASLRHQVRIKASRPIVYECLTTESGIGAWWNRPRASTSDGNSFWEFEPGPEHGVLRVRVESSVPDKHVEWRCVSQHPPTSPASAWTGTVITFAIQADGDKVILNFRHDGWDEDNQYYAFCNFQWGVALQKLKRECEARAAGQQPVSEKAEQK